MPDDEPTEPQTSGTEPEPDFAHDAFIDPDAPIVRREPPRTPEDFEEVVRRAPISLDDVVVTGIGDDAHLEDVDFVEPDAAVEAHIREMARAIERLGDALRLRGEAGLRTTPDMNSFEATLRAYCVGYLARARQQDEL